jgi:uncharacterized DUF497 family protein
VKAQDDFEWDEPKAADNLRKHGLDFADAWEIFESPVLEVFDDRKDYGEDRWIGVGILKGRAVVVVYTERPNGVMRIISLRKALSHERKRYEKALRDGLGAG